MARRIVPLFLAVLAVAAVAVVAGQGAKKAASDWHMNATIIEACSCPMFCQCYFNSEPAEHAGHEGHGGGHFCRFNMAFKVNKGHQGSVKLDGAKFWVAGDLGADFSTGKAAWAVVTFDKSMTPEQRDAVGAILGHVYPIEWGSFETAEGTIDNWIHKKNMAHATLNGGKTAEVKLVAFEGMKPGPVVIQNLKYWSAPRNDGFVLMPNEVEAWRTGDKAFEFRNSNGFMVTFDISSKDVTAGG